jgi:hypothetical protein
LVQRSDHPDPGLHEWTATLGCHDHGFASILPDREFLFAFESFIM